MTTAPDQSTIATPELTALRAHSLSVSFANVRVLDNVSLELPHGETLVVMGPSGGGKSTLLRCLSGNQPNAAGEVRFPRWEGSTAGSRNSVPVLMMDQEPLLFEHLTVFENLAFPLRMRSEPGPKLKRQVDELISNLELENVRRHLPAQLSGGQKQRCAFGRALLAAPAVLLMDEPFNALDNDVRTRLQSFFRKLATDYALSTVFVTHDLREALTVGTTFAMLDRGQLQTWSDAQSFAADPETGVDKEVQFWSEFHSPKRSY